jgi:F-type H+-transporting ATPase subunit b
MLSVDIAFVIVFLLVWILVLILTKVFFKPVGGIMRKRDALIRENREAARLALDDYERNLRKIEDDLKEAKAGSEKIREEFEAEALKERARLLSEIHSESRKQVEKAKGEIDRRIAGLKEELARQAEQLADRIEKKVIH